MAKQEPSTIAALATAPYPAGLAVVRISGPKSKLALNALFRASKNPVELKRTLVFGDLIDYKSGEVIDSALAVYMPGPFSYTGEDIAEFQFHGSPLLVQKILRSLFAFGVSPAEPGEFTLRAFLNGKIDLIQAEAISELINATSEQALKIAGDHLKGRFSQALLKIAEPLRDSLAQIETHIDFPEEDVSPETLSSLGRTLFSAKKELEQIFSTYAYGSIVREGYKVLLCGRPNVGKSSILNQLLGRERAIVSDISGTTRDLIEEEAIIAGYKFVFCDSAGLRESEDTVEKMGVELAKDKLEWAELVLFVVDATDTSNTWQETLDLIRQRASRIWMITNKIDLNPEAFSKFFCDSTICSQNFYISAKTKSGFDALTKALAEEVAASLPDTAQASNVMTNERQRLSVSHALNYLGNALRGIEDSSPMEIISADIRAALRALDEVVGRTYTEDILGRIFSKFCIGK